MNEVAFFLGGKDKGEAVGFLLLVVDGGRNADGS